MPQPGHAHAPAGAFKCPSRGMGLEVEQGHEGSLFAFP
jgi:hypothetical protein